MLLNDNPDGKRPEKLHKQATHNGKKLTGKVQGTPGS
jgi:hypothetical protein